MKTLDNIIDIALAILVVVLFLIFLSTEANANVFPAKKYIMGSNEQGSSIIHTDNYECKTYFSTDTTLVEGYFQIKCK